MGLAFILVRLTPWFIFPWLVLRLDIDCVLVLQISWADLRWSRGFTTVAPKLLPTYPGTVRAGQRAAQEARIWCRKLVTRACLEAPQDYFNCTETYSAMDAVLATRIDTNHEPKAVLAQEFKIPGKFLKEGGSKHGCYSRSHAGRRRRSNLDVWLSYPLFSQFGMRISPRLSQRNRFRSLLMNWGVKHRVLFKSWHERTYLYVAKEKIIMMEPTYSQHQIRTIFSPKSGRESTSVNFIAESSLERGNECSWYESSIRHISNSVVTWYWTVRCPPWPEWGLSNWVREIGEWSQSFG